MEGGLWRYLWSEPNADPDFLYLHPCLRLSKVLEIDHQFLRSDAYCPVQYENDVSRAPLALQRQKKIQNYV